MVSFWVPGGWLCVFRWGFGLRLPRFNLVLWLGAVR